MPSAATKLEKQSPQEAYDPVKQVLTIVEKKVRNLEKRKGKLDVYRQDSASGKELNEDQKKAVEKYDQVLEVLDFTKELQKQFQTVIQDCSKAQKKAAKREQLERQQFELQRIKEIILYQDLLTHMGGEDVRNDFLNGNDGAVKLTEEELNNLDELYKVICPERDTEKEASEFDEVLATAAEHIQSLLDGKNKELFGTTYKTLKQTLLKIQSCSYFSKNETDIPNEEENNNVPQEDDSGTEFAEAQYESQTEDVRNEIEESQPPLERTQPERPYYPMESSSLYTEQTHPPIQEVLSGQGNLNFLQESQIELESPFNNSQVPIAPSGSPYPNVQFSTAQSTMVGHSTRRPSGGDATNITANSIPLANSASLQQVGASIPTTQAIDFDPARPIQTQTYTNQSFTSAIHPMMAAAQNYVPVVTLAHAIAPQHVLAQNMVVQPLPPRSSVANTLSSNPNLPMASTHTSQLSTENVQPSCVPASQFEVSDMQENMAKNANQAFVNSRDSRGPRDVRPRNTGNTFQRNSSQVGFGNEQEYQSSNNSQQGYVNRDSFSDNSSYSSNLKRGLNSRGVSRGSNPARGTSSARGSRGSGYRN